MPQIIIFFNSRRYFAGLQKWLHNLLWSKAIWGFDLFLVSHNAIVVFEVVWILGNSESCKLDLRVAETPMRDTGITQPRKYKVQ